MTTNPKARAFTLIELLVVIAVIGIIVGITLPSLGTSRETARRLQCLANIKGLGGGLQLYMNDSDGIMPWVKPLHDDEGNDNDPSLLDVLAEYVSVPAPERGEDGFFMVAEPFRCPSDRAGTDEETNFEPLWRTDGTSYEYLTGAFQLLAELLYNSKDPARAVTRAYEADRAWPILLDARTEDTENNIPYWHPLRKGGPGQNALYFPDMRADWMNWPSDDEMERFFEDVARFSGGGG